MLFMKVNRFVLKNLTCIIYRDMQKPILNIVMSLEN